MMTKKEAAAKVKKEEVGAALLQPSAAEKAQAAQALEKAQAAEMAAERAKPLRQRFEEEKTIGGSLKEKHRELSKKWKAAESPEEKKKLKEEILSTKYNRSYSKGRKKAFLTMSKAGYGSEAEARAGVASQAASPFIDYDSDQFKNPKLTNPSMASAPGSVASPVGTVSVQSNVNVTINVDPTSLVEFEKKVGAATGSAAVGVLSATLARFAPPYPVPA